MTISFAGHSFVPSRDAIREIVKLQIRKNIVKKDRVVCYVGGYGDFDIICALACRELKIEGYNIESVYVTPYIDFSGQSKIKEMQKQGLCETSIYPPIENVPKRFAILKRNEWMMTNSELIIAYVKHDYGGAYKALQVAKRKDKRIINICELA